MLSGIASRWFSVLIFAQVPMFFGVVMPWVFTFAHGLVLSPVGFHSSSFLLSLHSTMHGIEIVPLSRVEICYYSLSETALGISFANKIQREVFRI